MRRLPISTPVVTTLLLAGVALAAGVSADWCIWWRAAYIVLILFAVGLLGMREVNRARIRNHQMREEFDEVRESTRASIDEMRNALTAQTAQFRRDMLREFREARQLQERALEAADPTYERPLRAHATISADLGTFSGNLSLQIIPPTRRERLRLRLIYILKWFWGTHDAPSARVRKS